MESRYLLKILTLDSFIYLSAGSSALVKQINIFVVLSKEFQKSAIAASSIQSFRVEYFWLFSKEACQESLFTRMAKIGSL